MKPHIVLALGTLPGSSGEACLYRAGYRFAWFDGATRFYLALGDIEMQIPFQAPPNARDDFVSAGTAWATRLAIAAAAQDATARRARTAESRAGIALDRAEAAQLRPNAASADAARMRALAERLQDALTRLQASAAQGVAWAQAMAESAIASAQSVTARVIQDAEAATAHAPQHLLAHHRPAAPGPVSNPGSGAGAGPCHRGHAPALPQPVSEAPDLEIRVFETPLFVTPLLKIPVFEIPVSPWPVAEPSAPLPPLAHPPIAAPPPMLPLIRPRAIHQFCAAPHPDGALLQAMLITRQVLRGLDYESHIFVDAPDHGLIHAAHTRAALPGHREYMLILHRAAAQPVLQAVLDLPVPRILFHNGSSEPAHGLAELPPLPLWPIRNWAPWPFAAWASPASLPAPCSGTTPHRPRPRPPAGSRSSAFAARPTPRPPSFRRPLSPASAFFMTARPSW